MKNASSKVAKAFKDDIRNEKQSTESYIGTFLYLIQVKAILFIVISATSYYQFLGSTPFKLVLGIIVSVGNSSQKYRRMWNQSGNDNEVRVVFTLVVELQFCELHTS